jgi:hypothetical protein
MPASVKIRSASGGGTPIGGTGVVIKFEINQKDLEDLITSKRLQKTGSMQSGLFSQTELDAMKQPEFYWTDSDTTWRATPPTGIRMAVDRTSGIVLYCVVP